MRFDSSFDLEQRINREIARCNHFQCVKLCELYLVRIGEHPKRKHLPKKINIVQMASNEIYNRLVTYGEGYDVLKDIL